MNDFEPNVTEPNVTEPDVTEPDVTEPANGLPVGAGAHAPGAVDRSAFDAEVAEHDRRERQLLWKEVAAVVFVAVFVVIRQVWQQ